MRSASLPICFEEFALDFSLQIPNVFLRLLSELSTGGLSVTDARVPGVIKGTDRLNCSTSTLLQAMGPKVHSLPANGSVVRLKACCLPPNTTYLPLPIQLQHSRQGAFNSIMISSRHTGPYNSIPWN